MPAVRAGNRAPQKQQSHKENTKSLKRKRDQEDVQKLQNAVDELVSDTLLEMSFRRIELTESFSSFLFRT